MTPLFGMIAFGAVGLALIGVIFYLCHVAYLQIRWRKTLKRRRLFLAEMRRLPIFQWSDELPVSDTCCSCCNTFQPQAEITVFPCRHSIHIPCAEEWILRGNLRCPICFSEIIPNSRIFTESDIIASPEAVLRGIRPELAPLLRSSLFQELKGLLGHRRHYLRVPSDLEDSSSTSHKGPPTPVPTPTITPPLVPGPPLVRSPKPKTLKSAIYSPGNVYRPKTVRIVTTGTPPPPDYENLELEGLTLSNEEEDGVDESVVIVSSSVLKRYSLSRDSVFCTPGTKVEGEAGGSGASQGSIARRSQDYYSLPLNREVQVDIHPVKPPAKDSPPVKDQLSLRPVSSPQDFV